VYNCVAEIAPAPAPGNSRFILNVHRQVSQVLRRRDERHAEELARKEIQLRLLQAELEEKNRTQLRGNFSSRLNWYVTVICIVILDVCEIIIITLVHYDMHV
jgi:hypothetical protein